MSVQTLSLGLFDRLQLGAYDLRNRIVMAPMTRSRAGVGDEPTTLMATYYAQRASAGLIITEAAHVAPAGVGYPHTPGIHNSAQVTGWSRVTQAVHQRGGRIFLQLWHAGRISHPTTQPDGGPPWAPSAIAPEGSVFTRNGFQRFVTPRELELTHIRQLIRHFAAAAGGALEAGFDGVDLHAANGYLIDQFLRSGSNLRTDEYGGPTENRIRFLLQVTEAVCEVWGASRVGVRLSPMSPQNSMCDEDPLTTFTLAAAALNDLGIGYIHVVEPTPGHPSSTPVGLSIIRSVRSVFSGRLIVDGGVNRATAESALLATGGDLVALATPFIANPDLVERLEEGKPLALADHSTFYTGGPRGYIDYPNRNGAQR